MSLRYLPFPGGRIASPGRSSLLSSLELESKRKFKIVVVKSQARLPTFSVEDDVSVDRDDVSAAVDALQLLVRGAEGELRRAAHIALRNGKRKALSPGEEEQAAQENESLEEGKIRDILKLHNYVLCSTY